MLSIVIPAYNEQDRLGASVARITEFLSARHPDYELLIVDDGSSDGTAGIAEELTQANPKIRLVRNPANRGKGFAVRNGMMEAAGDPILFSDADLSTPIEEIEKMLPLAARNDVVFASRGLPDSDLEVRQPLARHLTGRFFNLVIRLFFIPGVKDTQCGFKLFRRAAARELFGRATVDGWAFDVEVLAIAHKLGMSMAEVPVKWRNAPGTKVKLSHSFRILSELARIWFRLARDGSSKKGRGGD
ncbi:MAG TPA: glycosyltransferase family 2 protein [Candidatus Brocadiia bacterium]|nr:glycosyltransferase family 2 protein [Candidatus Brocadiia bacterium]